MLNLILSYYLYLSKWQIMSTISRCYTYAQILVHINLNYRWIFYLYHPLSKDFFKEIPIRASMVVQWLRICLPMQETRVRALVREDPTCRRATKPVQHNYWVCVPQLLKPVHLEPMLRNKRSHSNKPSHRNEE